MDETSPGASVILTMRNIKILIYLRLRTIAKSTIAWKNKAADSDPIEMSESFQVGITGG